jgi:hypothetical protein
MSPCDAWQDKLTTLTVVVHVALSLAAITLGDNLFAGLPRSCTSNKRSLRIRVLCRLLAAVPPLVAAGFMRQVGLCTSTSPSALHSSMPVIANPPPAVAVLCWGVTQ